MATVATNNLSPCKLVDLYDQRRPSHLTQLAAVVAAIAVPVILSTTGFLPSIIWKVSIGVIAIGFPLKSLMSTILCNFKSLKGDPKAKDEFTIHIFNKGPIFPCLLGPVIEETLFRGVLQGGLTLALRLILPVAAIAIGGTSILISSALAMVVASAVFGYAHARQSPIQAILAGFESLMFEATLFHFYGLHIACLAHIVNNTVVLLLATALMELLRKEQRQPLLA